MTYDVIVLGGGPGGYLAAERAGQAGLSVLLMEKTRLGGTCLNEGCIPTKTLLHSAKLYSAAVSSEAYGVVCEGTRIDHAAVVKRKRRVSETLVAGVKAGLRGAKVRVVEGEGRIKGRAEGGIAVECGGEEYLGRNLVLATGSHPVLPPIEGLRSALESGFAVTSTGILELEELPKSLAVVGGGVIGLEMATYFAMCGCAVTVVEAAGKIAGNVDADVTACIQRGCEARGMTFHLNAKAVAFGEGSVTVEEKGSQSVLSCDKALICIGRAANTQGFGLETLQVPTYPGGIRVDERCRAGVPGVYAVGDCTGENLLAHVAYRQAEVAVSAITGGGDRMHWKAVPSLVHTDPECACVGMTEEAAREAGIEPAVSKISMNYSGLYLAENENGAGIIKLVLDKKRRVLVGAHMAGGPASELITLCGVFIDNETPVDRIKEYVFPHPTNCEVIREAIFAAKL